MRGSPPPLTRCSTPLCPWTGTTPAATTRPRSFRGKELDGPEDEDDLDFDVIFGEGGADGYGFWAEEEEVPGWWAKRAHHCMNNLCCRTRRGCDES